MSSDYLARASIDASRHGVIDAELKSLKLLSRRLQSTLVAHATELQILHRLFYKNKNQHRGALFWRNISEVRRYAEKLEKSDLQNSTNVLRNSFYGTENANASKGPWTHCPNTKSMSTYAKKCETALQLADKTSEICLNAYRSFHRSMQSGAFLQVLLVFVAISSRLRAVSLELQDIFMAIHSCAMRLRDVALTKPKGIALDMSQYNDAPLFHTHEDTEEDKIDIDAAQKLKFYHSAGVSTTAAKVVVKPVSIKKGTDASPSTPRIIMASGHQKARKVSERDVANSSGRIMGPKKKKRKVSQNEIDDIFGF